MPFIPFAELRAIEASVKGKTLTWEESDAPLSDDPQWTEKVGTIKALSRKNDGYFVREMHVAHWVLTCNVTQRNIRIVEGK